MWSHISSLSHSSLLVCLLNIYYYICSLFLLDRMTRNFYKTVFGLLCDLLSGCNITYVNSLGGGTLEVAKAPCLLHIKWIKINWRSAKLLEFKAWRLLYWDSVLKSTLKTSVAILSHPGQGYPRGAVQDNWMCFKFWLTVWRSGDKVSTTVKISWVVITNHMVTQLFTLDLRWCQRHL